MWTRRGSIRGRGSCRGASTQSLGNKKNEPRASLVQMTDRSCSQPSLPGRLPLCAGEALALRARGRPPVHSVDPYSYLVRVPAGGLSGKVLLKQKVTLTHESRHAIELRPSRTRSNKRREIDTNIYSRRSNVYIWCTVQFTGLSMRLLHAGESLLARNAKQTWRCHCITVRHPNHAMYSNCTVHKP